MSCKSLRSSTRDAEIATHLLQSLEIFLTASASKKGAPGAFNISIAQALPSDVLVKIGETHLADSEVITPLCNCIVLQATSSMEYRDDFVNAGTIAIPLRVFDQAEVHTPQACASSASLLKELLIESRRAASQFMDAGGPRLILKVLSKHADDAPVVCHTLSALAVAAQFVPVRRALAHPELPHTLTLFDQIFRVAEAHVSTTPDVLSWACLAAGALSECEHEESQEIMRKAMDMELLQALVTKLQSTFYTSVDMDFCNSLISDAAQSDLSDPAILTANGEIIKKPPRRADTQLEPSKSFHAETVAVLPAPSKVQGDWHDPLDVFAPLRGLGVGAAQSRAAITQDQIAVLRGVASAPVKPDVASKFMRALRDQYIDGQKGSVDKFMTRRGPDEEGDDGNLYEGSYLLSTDEQRLLKPFIQRMEEAQDKQKEYKEIEHRWNVKAAEDEQEDQGFLAGIFGESKEKAEETPGQSAAPPQVTPAPQGKPKPKPKANPQKDQKAGSDDSN